MHNNLSGGQQQRVAIARALITKPAICETYTIAGEITGERAYNDPQCFSALGVSGWFLMPSYLVERILPDGFDLNSELLVSTDWNNKETAITEEVKQIVSEIDSHYGYQPFHYDVQSNQLD